MQMLNKCTLLYKYIFSFQFPEHGLYGLEDKILLFRHDQNDPNILKHVDSISEVVADTLIEVVLSGKLCSPVSCTLR